MDLPVSRIAQGNFKQTDVGLDIIDCVYNQKLISLDCVNVSPGDYVIMAKENETNKHYLFSMSSEYEYETLNRRALLKAIENKLSAVGITALELGVLLEHEPGIYEVKGNMIRTLRTEDGKCGYTFMPRGYRIPIISVPVEDTWHLRHCAKPHK